MNLLMKDWNEKSSLLIPTKQELKQIEQSTSEPDNFDPDNPLGVQ